MDNVKTIELTPKERFELIQCVHIKQISLNKELKAARDSFADGNPHGYDEDYLKFLGRKIDTMTSILTKLRELRVV